MTEPMTQPQAAAHAASLLVCLDFDGTLAQLNADPYAVSMHPAAEDALRRLAVLPATRVAILTGRHLDGLRRVLPPGLAQLQGVVLAGSHGAEPGPELAPDDLAYLDDIERRLRDIARDGAYVEVKPYQRALHVAPVADAVSARAMLDAALALPTDRPVTEGTNVVEFSAVEVTKGSWLARFKKPYAVTVFAGDDDTDEHAVAALSPHDLGIKVGDKPSAATLRLAGVDEMAAWLQRLAAEREAWAAGS